MKIKICIELSARQVGYAWRNTSATILGIFLLISPWFGTAQADANRSLYWDTLDVIAHLDADGRLHVRELQRIVFDGNWNGGMRQFYYGDGQELFLERLVRIDAQGEEHLLVPGELDQVDHYGWSDNNTLRWRARLPSDPPFQATAITYRIDYVLSEILRYTNDSYELDHDFAFTDRPGDIRHFKLQLTFDSVWKMDKAVAPLIEAQQLRPGLGMVVSRTLHYLGPGFPQAVRHGALPQTRALLLQLVLAGGMVLIVLFLWHEVRAGRFRRLMPLREINPAWIKQHILIYPPEVVGALWDDRLGAAEVAAVLARMTQEAKLVSRVEISGGLFKKQCLHLTLKVPRDTLQEHERKLIDALFFDGQETDTDKVRAHYRHSGFNPVNYITDAVESQVRSIVGPALPSSQASRLLMFAIFGTMIFMPVHFFYGTVDDILIGALAVVATFIFLVLALIAAGLYNQSYTCPVCGMFYLVGLIVLAALPVIWLLRDNPYLNSAYLIVELIILWFLSVRALLMSAQSNISVKEREQQHRLRSARVWFKAELSKSKPALEDAWYPYLLAFGLGHDIDRWFGAFGKASALSSGTMNTGDTSGSSFTSSSGTWRGGGGNFGGGGATGTWASAVSGLAASISSASSSSSSSGSSSSSSSSSGGSSSGGGGGGGW